MTQKQIIKGKNIYICNICGNEMEEPEGLERLALVIQNKWWSLRNFKVWDICFKHRKQIRVFLEELKSKEKKDDKEET